MKEPSETLREEHDVIEHLIHALRGMAQAAAAGEEVPRHDIDDALEVAVNFADRCHHAKEEKTLFPALRKASPKEGALLVHRLEGDHKAFRQLVAAIRGSTRASESGDPIARSRFVKSTQTYVSLLQEHIRQETAQLLPLTDTALSPAERLALGREFERIEREEIGPGLHEKYEKTIHHLVDAYVHDAGRHREGAPARARRQV